MGSVERIWPASTIVCIACGPSLTSQDVEFVRGRARVIAINTSYKLAPWADVLYACDERWWGWEKGAPSFQGRKFSLDPASKKWPGVTVLKNTGESGLEGDSKGLRTGKNSGYQAVNLAVHLGASRIVLLGYDMQNTNHHWFGKHPSMEADHGKQWCGYFQTLVAPLQKLGIQVVNCTRKTALTCFPKARLEDVLPERLEQAS